MGWEEAQEWERSWWGACVNTYNEERKHFVYASKMGLSLSPNAKTQYRFDLNGISVLDIGGGPCSLLLKCENIKGKVIDPLPVPEWVKLRYESAGLDYEQIKGEDINETGYDEVFIYNVLQHTDNPEQIIQNAKRAAKIIRIFEWVNTSVSIGHPQILTAKNLNRWLGGEGKVEQMNEGGCVGLAYYGVFIGGE